MLKRVNKNIKPALLNKTGFMHDSLPISGDLGGYGRPEDIMQAECFLWAHNTYPQTRKHLFHVPNGGKRSRVEAARFKSMGVVPGVHDLLFFWYGVLYTFELKVRRNTQSDDQLEFGRKMSEHGAVVFEIRDPETFKKIFTKIVTTKPGEPKLFFI